MEISEIKKPNKYAALATYLIAVVCLLLGLFLPLFNDKGILALQLPDALNALANKSIISSKKPFTLPYPIDLFGLEKVSVDVMALTVILYAVITVLALLALIPIGISTKRESRTACGFMFFIEAAAVIVLSVYLIIALENIEAAKISYNMVIALCGSAAMLIVLSLMCKRGTGAAKVVLFLLSAIGLLMLFDWLAFEKLETPLGKIYDKLKVVPSLIGIEGGDKMNYTDGMTYLSLLFEGPYSTALKAIPGAKNKALIVLITIVALLVIINYIVDAAALATNGKKAGHMFNLVRYGLEFAAILCLVITVLIVKAKIGLMLYILIIAVLIQLIMSIVRFLMYKKRAASFEDTLYSKPAKQPKQLPQETENYEQPLIAAPAYEQTVIEEVAAMPAADVAPAQPEEEILYEDPNVVQTVIDDVVAPPPETKSEPVKPVQPTQPTQPVRPVQPEPIIIDIVQPERTVEQPVYVKHEQPKPQPEYRQYEQPKPQPEYRQYEQPKPQPEYRRYEQPKPQPEYRQYEQPKPQPEYKRYEQPKPQPEYRRYEQPKPVQPEPAPAPAPVRDETTRVYTINTIYGGPTDEFIKKLSNEERIEFARTFIEKSNGDIGNIPEYVIGGNNKKFFSSVFIYLGRIRGLISDGLLNKMYKELNMM